MKSAKKGLNRDQFTGSLIDMQDQLFYYALQLTEDREDAQDLVQETSYKALKNRSKLHDNEHIRAWLYTILKNTYINYLRSSHYKQLVHDAEELDYAISQNLSATSDTPDELMTKKELIDMVKRLPGVYEKPIQLFLTGYSYKEISKEMNIPIGTVKSRIHLGKKQIRKVYTA